MNSSRMLRRSFISVGGFLYYFAIVSLTGLDTRLTTMGQFFGHAMIYGASVALVSALFFILDQSSSKRREEALAAKALTLSPTHEEET